MKVLIRPVITEKSMIGAQMSKFAFEVMPNANKHQIAQAIKEIYKVDVVSVNVLSVKAEEKIVRGRFLSKIKGKKKVIVTLKKGQKIEGFEVKE